MYEDDEEDDDIRSKSSSIGLAEVPDWQLVKRRTKRSHVDAGEDEEEMELEEPADETEDAMAELPTKLQRSDHRRDQVEGVLIGRLSRAHAKDTMVVALIDTTCALMEGKEGGWEEAVGTAEVLQNMYHYVQNATPREAARAIRAMGEGGMMRRSAQQHGQLFLQNCMKEPWNGAQGAPSSHHRVSPAITKMTTDRMANDQYLWAAGRGGSHMRTPPKSGKGKGGGKGGGRGGKGR